MIALPERVIGIGRNGRSAWPESATVYSIVVSVKGGRTVNPAMVRELRGTMERERAALSVLVTLEEPTAEMRREAVDASTWKDPTTGKPYPRLQLLSVADIFGGKKVEHPGVELAERSPDVGETLPLPGFGVTKAPPRRNVMMKLPEAPPEPIPAPPAPIPMAARGPRKPPRRAVDPKQAKQAPARRKRRP